MRAPAELSAAFRSAGRKVTPQRELIFSILHGDPTHPTAEAVHERVVAQLPSVSLRTVYATLHDLAEMGELVPLDVGTGSTRFDPNTDHHQHLVCADCGRVQDVQIPHPPLQVDPEAAAGFEVAAIEIVLRGRCLSCAAVTTSPESGKPVHSTIKEQPTHG